VVFGGVVIFGFAGRQAAALGDLFIWFSHFTRFTSATFLVYATPLLPSFGFNSWFL
jgi:hypothetical protein